jgi:hypothetical protein
MGGLRARKIGPPHEKVKVREVKLKVSVARVPNGFWACVIPGGHGLRSASGRVVNKQSTAYQMACGGGSNPRKAIAAALAKASKQMVRRKGAFRGLR